MAVDILSGFGGSFTRNALNAFGAVALAAAYSTSALGQTEGVPAAMAASIYADCQTQPGYQSINPDGTENLRPLPAAGGMQGSKSTAILGGQRSKLEEMRDSQAALQQNAHNFAPLSTAALTVVQAPRAKDCTTTIPANLRIVLPEADPALPSSIILGTLSLAIKRSPFDRDWAAVSKAQVSRKMHRTLTATGARKSGDEAAQVEAVNRWVNRNINFGEDRDVYGRADYWAPAAETLRRGIGDCEDFAIAKMDLLSALGISRDKMRLVVARDLVRNADHAVLVVTLADGPVMLDNMTDRLLDARLPNDYRPIMSFSQNAKWVHGYAAQPAQPVRMASIAPLPQPAALQAREVLTVTAEPELPVVSFALLIAPSVLPTVLL